MTNYTNHDITLPGRVGLGCLKLVFSGLETLIPSEEPPFEQHSWTEQSESDMSWLPEVDLSGLAAEQKQQAKQLLFEEAEAFSRNDDDIGCIPELEMDIKLTSDQPVQKNYLSIPCPLYPEVKGYIEESLNRGFT